MTDSPAFDIDRATTGLVGRGVFIDDPEAPFLLNIVIRQTDGVPRMDELSIIPKQGMAIRQNWLRTLPLRQIFMAAVALSFGSETVNESYYRRIAAGGVAPLDDRILSVAEWATQIRRPGGQAQAIADLWGVNVRTAHRWLRRVRERARADAASAPEDRQEELATVPEH